MWGKTLKSWLRRLKDYFDYRKDYIKWRVGGKPIPPPHYAKQLLIRKYREQSQYDIFVESGTYLGEMVDAQRKHFSRVISIELSQAFFERAKEKFRKRKNVEILLGDSGEVMKEVVPTLDRPALFWLDGHYSVGNTARGKVQTPILNELEAIFLSGREHIILIDDARYFNGTNDYLTLECLEDLARKAGYSLSVEDDIIRLEKKQAAESKG